MLFYRIEDEYGKGMYTTIFSDISREMFELDGRHPAPCNEEGLGEYLDGMEGSWKNYRYAFKSLEQLKNWIYKKEWRTKLKRDGLKLIVIDAKGFHGNTQAVFDSTTRKEVGILDLELI